MALDSTSTLAEIQAEYLDNMSYEREGSTTKARLFIEACMALALRTPKRTSHGGGGGSELEIDTAVLQSERDKAERWLSSHKTVATGGAGAQVLVFNEFR